MKRDILIVILFLWLSPSRAQTLPSVATGVASQVGNNSAQLSGTINPNWTTVYWQFQIGTTTAYGINVPSSLAGGFTGNGNYNENWTALGLLPGTLYHFRMAGSNSNGNVYGADSTFVTTGGPPAPTPPPTPTPPPPNSVTLAWNPPATVTGYKVSYGTVHGGPYPTVVNAGNNLTLTLTGLTSGTTYYAVVQSFDVNGVIYCPSNEISFTAP